jgi:hypothetical protein
MIKALKDKETGVITLFNNQKDHLHQSTSVISSATKEKINQQIAAKQQPAKIRDLLLV